MNLLIQMQGGASAILFCGHLTVALAYLGIAFALQLFVAVTADNARIIAKLFRLFSYFTAACGLQHILAAMLFVYPFMNTYIASVWITGIFALFTLGFMWRLRPKAPPTAPIVVVPS